MKKLKFVLTFVLLSLIAVSGMLFGCANKYANMKIETSETELVFYYGGTADQAEEMTKTFSAEVLGAPNDVSTDLKYELTNDIVTIEKTKNENTTTFELVAKPNVGTTADLILRSIESDSVRAVVHLSIVCRISSISPNEEFSTEAFVEISDDIVTKEISQNAIKYEPSATSQRNLTYSLKSNIVGISVQDNSITINPEELSKNVFDFEIEAKSTENESIVTTISYHIVRKFNLSLNLDDEVLTDELVMTTNNQFSDKNTINLKVETRYLSGSMFILDDYTVKSQIYLDEDCTIVDQRRLLFTETDNENILLTALKNDLDNPYIYLKVFAKLDDYNYETEPFVAKIKIEKVATEISLNYLENVTTQNIYYELRYDGLTPKVVMINRLDGEEQIVDHTSDATFEIYNEYYVETSGSEFNISVGKDNDQVENKSFVLFAPEGSNVDKIIIVDKKGREITPLTSFDDVQQIYENIVEGGKIFVKAKDTSSTSVLQIVSVASILNLNKIVAYTMIFNATEGVTNIQFDGLGDSAKIINNVAYVPVIDDDNQTKVGFAAVGHTSKLSVSASNEILIFSKNITPKNNVFFELMVSHNARYQNAYGDVEITLKADNNFEKKFVLKVFAKVDFVKVGISNTKAMSAIYDENESLESFALAKNETEVFNVGCYYGSKLQNIVPNIKYDNYDRDSISIYVNNVTMKSIGEFEITLKIELVDDESPNGILSFQKVIKITGYLSIRSVRLSAAGEANNKTSFTLYSADKLGQDYIGEIGKSYDSYISLYNYKKMNLSVTFSDGTIFDGQENDAISISYSVSSSLSSITFERENDYVVAKSNGQNIFEVMKTATTVFEVSANRGLENSYDIYLTVTITQLQKKTTVTSRYIVSSPTTIKTIANMSFVDNTTGKTEAIKKEILSNIVSENDLIESGDDGDQEVYYVYRPFTRLVGDGSQYELVANISPTNPLVKDLDFDVKKYNDEDKVSEDKIRLEKSGTNKCKIKVSESGLYIIEICAKDSKRNDTYGTKQFVFLKIADGKSEESSIEIRTAIEFEDMLKLQTEDRYYRILNDIDISLVDTKLFASKVFEANINGQYAVKQNGETKTYNSTISGIYLEKIYGTDGAQTNETKQGIFESIAQNAQIKNIDFVINRFKYNIENFNIVYIGGLAGINNGKIENINVRYLNETTSPDFTILDNAKNTYIGGIVGRNNGEIIGCYTSGNIYVGNTNNQNFINVKRFVGGLVGTNANLVDISADKNPFFNNPKPNDNYTSTMNITVEDNNREMNGEIEVGGIVGENFADASILNVSFAGKVVGADNVGGIVGKNDGTISNLFAECYVEGKQNVGGIAGYSSKSISNCAVIIYSTENKVVGENYVGGIVGKIENGNITLCYAKSFVSRESNDGDIKLLANVDEKFEGGLAGYSDNCNISKSFAMITLNTQNSAHKLGGIVGFANNSHIQNCYERNTYNLNSSNSTISLDFGAVQQNCTTNAFYCSYQNINFENNGTGSIIKPTNENYLSKLTYAGLNENDWYYVFDLNDENQETLAEYPFIKYFVESNLVLLTLEKPTDVFVEATMQENIISKVPEEEDTYIIWKSGTTKLSFSEIFNVIFTLNNSKISQQDVNLLNISQEFFLTSSSQNVSIEIVGETSSAYMLNLLQEGESVLTMTSKSNKELSKSITIFVKNVVDLKRIDVFGEKINEKFIINQNYQFEIVSNSGADDYYFDVKFDDEVATEKIHINGSPISQNTNLKANIINSIVAKEKVDGQLVFTPYILYKGQKIYDRTKVLTLDVSSIYGIDNFEIDTHFANISPNSQLMIFATAESKGFENVSIDNLEIEVSGENQNLLELLSIQKHIDKFEQERVDFSISVAMNYDKVLENNYFDKEFEVRFIFKLDSIQKVQVCTLSFQKLSLQNIALDFYKNVQKSDSGDIYDTLLVSSNSIISGNLGIMQINIAPHNTEINNVIIYHSQSDSYALNFTQLLKYQSEDNQNKNFIDIGHYVRSVKNGFGIELFKLSEYGTNSFDGNIYAGLIISKSVPQNVEFKIYVEVTYNGNMKMTKQISLYSEKSSELQLSYNFNGKNYMQGSVSNPLDSIYIPLDVEKTITISATDLFTVKDSKEEIAKSFSFELNGITSSIKVDASEVNVYQNQVSINLPIKVSKYGDGFKICHLDQEFYLQNSNLINFVAVCNRITSGSNRVIKTLSDFKIHPMLFVVKDVQMNIVQDEQRYLPIENVFEIKRATPTYLKAIIDYEYAEQNSVEVLEQIEVLTEKINNVSYISILSKLGQQNVDGISVTKENDKLLLSSTKVTNEYKLSLKFNLIKNENVYDIVFVSESMKNNDDGLYGNINQIVSHTFDLDVYRDVSDKDAIPVATSTQFKNLKQGEVYRLVPMKYVDNAVIVLENYMPIELPNNVEFDGNGQTILIKSFNANYKGTNYGLFSKIGENSIVKNLNVKYEQKVEGETKPVEIKLLSSSISSFNFGGIVAENSGIVFNCSVEGSVLIEIDDITANIAGLVSRNSGFISYSTSKLEISANKGYVSGFVSINSKKISSSKVLIENRKKIENTNDQVSEKSALSGFVMRNSGEIDSCYVEGGISKVSEQIDFANSAKLKTNAVLAGFVYDNQGTVTNAYVNCLIDSARAGGFVYTNSSDIKNCYTNLTLTPQEENNDQIAPFVGVDQLSSLVNNTGLIKDCYYKSANFGQSFAGNQIAEELIAFDKSSFTKFVFASSIDDGDGIWYFESYPQLVEPNRIIESIYQKYDGYYEKIENHYVLSQKIESNKTYYKLNSTDEEITINILKNYVLTTDTELQSKQYYVYDEYMEEKYIPVENPNVADIAKYYELIEYAYVIGTFEEVEPTDNEITKKVWDNIKFEFGTDQNPYLIASEDDWNVLFTNGKLEVSSNANFVLLCDIEISSTPLTASDYTFEGKLSANNMTIKKLYINQSEVAMVQNFDAMGLFAKANLATIKNLNIETIYNILANDIESVGILTGVATDSNFINIKISAEDVVIIGKNFVGGLAGKLMNTNIVNVDVMASVNAVYAVSGQTINLKSNLNNFVETSEAAPNYSYSGIVAGIISGNSNAKLINISGKSIALGYYTGLAFGLVDKNANIKYVFAKVQNEQYIKGYAIAGGLVGENRGTILSSGIDYAENQGKNLSFFKGNPMFAGGLVGFNNGGTIDYSYCNIDTRVEDQTNVQKVFVVGGFVGVACGGEINHSFVTGSVCGEVIIGGFVGAVSDDGTIKNGLFSPDSYIKSGEKLNIKNSFVSNQWISITNEIDDAIDISDAMMKGTVVGAIVNKNIIYGDVSEVDAETVSQTPFSLENVYFNTHNSSYNGSEFIADKFINAFAIDKNLMNDSKANCIGGYAANFDTSERNLNVLYGAKIFVNNALICNTNINDFDLIYSKTGIYSAWSQSNVIIPTLENHQNGIYPTIIVNINLNSD